MSFRRSCLHPFRLALAVLVSFGGISHAQVFTDVLNFGKWGSNPYFVALVQGRDGRLYGATLGSGASDEGAVFAVDPSSGLRFVLHNFDTATGASPQGGVTLGTDGNFYGTAQTGGSSNYGVLFKLTPSGTYTVLHDFLGGTDGLNPASPPIQGTDGNFYGTTGHIDAFGETQSTAYRYSPSSGFTSFGDIPNTQAPMIQASDGNLYGTTYAGGVVELSTSGVLLNVYALPSADGNSTLGPVMQASDGNFYGVAQAGGASNYGTIYEMSPSGVFSLLYSMTATSLYPDGGLVEGTDGNLYGDAWGEPSSLFQIPLGGGTFTLLHTLTGVEGAAVGAALLQHTNGKFYGTAYGGGPGKGSSGTLFSLDMGLGAFVALVKSQGRVGGLAQILGQGFTGATSVTFNGVVASSFHVVSNTYMTAVAPTGAASGPVVVTTPDGTLTSNRNFQILH